jgi:uncharacterized protein YbjT (DUF2867 family)
MILIVGATGKLGGLIASHLLTRGQAVRIFVRANSPSHELAQQGLATAAQTLIDAGAEPAYGDLKDPSSLAAACAGIDTVITTANAAMRGGEDTFERVDRDGTKALMDAAKATGVCHFIYTSALGSAPNHSHPLFNAKGQCEAHLKTSGLTYTILQPGPFMEGWLGAIIGIPMRAGQPVTLVGKGVCKQAFVSIRDVAAYAVASVDNSAAHNQILPLAATPLYSWTEAVAAVERATGRSIPIRYVQSGEPIPLVPPSMGALLSALEMADSIIDMATTAATYDIKPTSVDAFAQQFFGKW